MKIYNLTLTIEPSKDGGFFIECPALQGCHSNGKTRGQALKNIREAIHAHLADRIADGEALPAGLVLTEDEYDNLVADSRENEGTISFEEFKTRVRSNREE